MSISEFKKEVESNIHKLSKDKVLAQATKAWFEQSLINKYSYNFTSFSVPIIQYPQDMVALQELIWEIKPDLIIETGIAHGGSLVFSASVLAMLDYCEAFENNTLLDPKTPNRKVIGVDIDIREHNKKALDEHPLRNRLVMIEGSSIDVQIIEQVKEASKEFKKIMVFLDSNHTHKHVLSELEAYAQLTSKGSYCVVFDTIIRDLPDSLGPKRNGVLKKTHVQQ